MADSKPSSSRPSPSVSTASSPRPHPLVFVDVSDPAAIDSQTVRRLVRSSATRHSHRDPTRKPKSRRSDRRPRNPPRITRIPTFALSEKSSSDDDEEDGLIWSLTRPSQSLFTHHERQEISHIIEQLVVDEANPWPTTTTTIWSERHAAAQPSTSSPIDAQAWLPWVFNYYRTVYLPQGISILQESESEGEEFIKWFMQEGHSEPALFYMQLLAACTQAIDSDPIPQPQTIWLQSVVIRSINDAISDPERATSNATLLAVAFLALHEQLFGDQTVAVDVHGRAFAQMIRLRGGVEQLRLPRIAWRLLLWIDTLISPESTPDRLATQLTHIWVPIR